MTAATDMTDYYARRAQDYEAIYAKPERQADLAANNDKAVVRANAKAIFDDGYSWVGGNPEGDITLVEFMDYRCTYCRRAYDEVNQLLETDGNIRFIVKEFPILGEQSTLASQYAVAVMQVYGGDSYELIHDALMTLRSDVSVAILALSKLRGIPPPGCTLPPQKYRFLIWRLKLG